MISGGTTPPTLFPLPLTAFEQYMFADDRPRYPMSFFIEIEVAGPLLREPFELAMRLAIERNPLLNSCVQSTWRGKQWVPFGQQLTVSWTDGDPALPTVLHRFLDLRNEPGLRIWVGHRLESSRIVFQFHHAATDGIGAIQLIGDLLAIYGQATCRKSELAPELAPVDSGSLRYRGQRFDPGWQHQGSMFESLGRIAEIIGVHPCALSIPKKSPTIETDSTKSDPFVTRIIERPDVQLLKNAAARQGVTLNELYSLAMFRALHGWNKSCGHGRDSQPMRIGLPVSLRTPAHDATPAANILSLMFVTQRGRDMHDKDALLRSIHRHIGRVMSAGDHAVFALIMEWTQRLPGGLHLLTRLPRRIATAMLANVGEVKRQLRHRFPLVNRKCTAGNITLEHLLGAAPIRPGTRLGASLGTYAGRLFINFNVDPHQLTREQAQQIADQYVARLSEIGASPSLDSSDSDVASVNQSESMVSLRA